MNTTRSATFIATTIFTLFGFSQSVPTQKEGSTTARGEQATFVNRVWRVAESTGVAPGHLCVFSSEGTLVVTPRTVRRRWERETTRAEL